MPDPLFKITEVRIDTLGGYLLKIREQLNFDVKTVSILTQIKVNYLESLERSDWDALPSDVYIRGFIKSLARVYNLDEAKMIEQYEKEHGFAPKIAKPKTEHKRTINITPKTILVLVTLFLGVAGAGYVVSQVSSILSPPMLEISEPSEDVSVQGNSLVIAGKAEVGADVMINEQIVLTDRNGQFTENLVLSSGLNVVEIVVRNKFKRESKVVRRVNAEIPTIPVAAPTLPVIVTIEVGPESAWIYMEADGVVVQRGTMLPGSSKTVSATDDILLTSANAGSTKVIYNGKDLGLMGRASEVIRNVEFSSNSTE